MGFMGGGEPPAEEKSELFWGDNERASEELSSHCYGQGSQARLAKKGKNIR